MELRDRSYKEPKELGEMGDALEGILKAALKPGDASAKLTGLMAELPKLLTAVDGYEKVGEEVKSEHMYEWAGGLAGRLAKAALHKEEEAAPPA